MSAPLAPEVALEANIKHASPTPTLTEQNVTAEGSKLEKTPSRISRRPTHTTIEQVQLAEKPKGAQFALILVGIYLAVYLFCLDISIVAPALPEITNDFGDTSQALWFFSVYLAINTAFQPPFGQYFAIAPKWTFIVCLILFEAGSLICAVAGSSELFIFGRAIAGVGSAGGYIGALAIIAVITEPHETAKYANGVGAVYSLGAVSGPLIGGAFTSHVTWRWCFYINLPIGAITVFACFIFLKQAPRKDFWHDFWIVVKNTDFVGLTLVVGALLMLLMALQWGGLEHEWDSSIVIGLLVGFGLTVLALCAWIWWYDERAYLRPRLLKKRMVWTGALHNFGVGGAYFTIITVLAYYFQIRGSSAIRSGVQLLPIIAGVITSLVLGGGLVPKIGYVNPLLVVGEIFMLIPIGLMVTFDNDTSTAYWAGVTYWIGFGAGLCWMMPFVATQVALSDEDREVGTTHVLFPQTLGGAIVFGVGQAIFQNKWVDYVEGISDLPDAVTIAESGITSFLTMAPEEFIPRLQVGALDALQNSYYMPIAILGLAIIVVFPFTPWLSVKPPVTDETQPEHIKQENKEKEVA